MRLHAAKPTRRIPAIAKRRPAPQKGGSSRLLKRTATKFVPPIRTTAMNTERTAVDGRFITPTIRVSARPYPWPMASRRGATVELREVTKRYGDTVAVDHLSLTAPAGRICVLIGPSGCGKTTSLRMVNRLIEPTSGEILIDGQNVLREDSTQLRRRIGYVIQQVGLFPHRTIGQNVATVPELLGWPAARIRARGDELLSLIGTDRGLKRLALLTVGGADLDPPVDPSRLDGAPVLSPKMTLRDALAVMLASETQVGMVRDGDSYLGVLTLSHIGRLLRTEEQK